MPYRLATPVGATDGTRTRTISRQILSLLRLPFRHSSLSIRFE